MYNSCKLSIHNVLKIVKIIRSGLENIRDQSLETKTKTKTGTFETETKTKSGKNRSQAASRPRPGLEDYKSEQCNTTSKLKFIIC